VTNAPTGTVFKDRGRTGETVLATRWSRPYRDADSMGAGLELQNGERIFSGNYIHARRRNGESVHRKLWLHPDAFQRHRPIVNIVGMAQRDYRKQPLNSAVPGYGFRSFNGTGKHGAVCDAVEPRRLPISLTLRGFKPDRDPAE